MRILFASGKPLYPIGEGGGETAAHDLLSGLVHSGCSIQAVGQAGFEELPRLNDALRHLGSDLAVNQEMRRITSFTGRVTEYPHRTRFSYDLAFPTTLNSPTAFLGEVERLLAGGEFDLLLFQAERSPELLAIAKARGVYPLFYAHNGLELRGFPQPEELPLILTSSAFFQDRLRTEYGVNARVLHPAVDLERYRVAHRSDEYITMVNPVAVKGVAPFLKVAAALPHRKFLAVESWETPPAIVELIRTRFPNVTYLERTIKRNSSGLIAWTR